MKTLRKIHGPYLFVLIAMGGLVASSHGALILVLVLTLGTMAAVIAAYKNKGADSQNQ